MNMNMKSKLYGLWAMVAIILATAAPSAFAYEEDTHFIMTYVICRSVGFTDQEAIMIAAVDQGMDDSTNVNAHVHGKPQVRQEWLWHALDHNGKMHAAGIIERKRFLAKSAIEEKHPEIRLIKMGIFFHYQQDTWAHRHHDKPNHLSYDAYTTYNTPVGHALEGSQPDRPPYDPVASVVDLEDGIRYAMRFLWKGLGREPNTFFKGYKIEGGKEDDEWGFLHGSENLDQISLKGIPKDSPRLYLNELIRKQIDLYETDLLGYLNNAHVSKNSVMRKGLQEVCDKYKAKLGDRVVIPDWQRKVDQGFTKMTSTELEKYYEGEDGGQRKNLRKV